MQTVAWIPDNRFAVAYRDIGKAREHDHKEVGGRATQEVKAEERKLFRYDGSGLWDNSNAVYIVVKIIFLRVPRVLRGLSK